MIQECSVAAAAAANTSVHLSFLSLLKQVEVQISEPLRVFNIIFK